MRPAPVVGALALFLSAPSREPVARAQEIPAFRADAQVVVLDMVVRDGDGRPVNDLRPDEVQVYENGERCELASFRLVRAAQRPAANVTPTSTAMSPRASGGGVGTPSRANLVVLVFDPLSATTAPSARRGALDLLSRTFPPDTWFAVFKISHGVRMLQPFTTDPAALEAAVQAATFGDDARREAVSAAARDLQTVEPPPASPTGPGGRPDITAPPQLGDVAGVVGGLIDELALRQQAFDSLHGLLAIAQALADVQGRKSVLYFAEARQAPAAAREAGQQAVSSANRGNVTIHTIDTRGLSSHRPSARSSFDTLADRFTVGSGTRGGETASVAAQPATVDTSSADRGGGALGHAVDAQIDRLSGPLLEHLAHDTGGLAIADTNDLGAGLARVVEELGQYYEVVYVPPHPEPDGRFRRIEARVSRRGAHVRTRSGYFATPSAPVLRAYELPLLAALGAASPPHDFPHRASVLHFSAEGGERRGLLLAQVPLAGVKFAPDAAQKAFHGQLTLLARVKDERGRIVTRLSHDWPIGGPLAGAGQAKAADAVFRGALTLPPGRYELETAVQDREGGALSVETSTFSIPSAGGRLATGSLSVVRRAEAVSATAADDPLRVASVSIQPELGTPMLASSQSEVPLFLPIYPSLSSAPAALELELRRNGRTVARATPALPAPEPTGRIAWIGSIAAKSLTPGPYEVLARVRQGDETAEETARFEVRPGSAGRERAPRPVPADIAPLLEQAARYVLEYEGTFHDIVAEEVYTQWTQSRDTTVTALTVSCAGTSCRRITRADIAFIRLEGAIPWGTFRDVFEVDGNKVRDHEARLEAIFSASSPGTGAQRAQKLLNESARYNIGPALRNINFPTLSLLFLHPRNQARFEWKRGGHRRFGNVDGVGLEFAEVVRPTLVDRNGQGDLPAKGRVWIDPTRGTLLRSETTFQFEEGGSSGARAYVAVEYRAEPKLAMWVPAEMREEYEDLHAHVFGAPSQATARYSNFRRFTVSIENETARLPNEPRP